MEKQCSFLRLKKTPNMEGRCKTFILCAKANEKKNHENYRQKYVYLFLIAFSRRNYKADNQNLKGMVTTVS